MDETTWEAYAISAKRETVKLAHSNSYAVCVQAAHDTLAYIEQHVRYRFDEGQRVLREINALAESDPHPWWRCIYNTTVGVRPESD